MLASYDLDYVASMGGNVNQMYVSWSWKNAILSVRAAVHGRHVTDCNATLLLKSHVYM